MIKSKTADRRAASRAPESMARRHGLPPRARHGTLAAAAVLALMTLGACAARDLPPARELRLVPAVTASASAPAATRAVPAAVVEPAPSVSDRTEDHAREVARPATDGARIIRGTDEVIAPPPARVSPVDPKKAVSLKFEQAPVREVVNTILGDLLGLTYVLHQPLDSTVTMSTGAPIQADQALSTLETILQTKGIVMVQDQKGVFHIGAPESLRGIVSSLKRVEQSPLPPGHGTVILPLKFIGAAEMAEILRPVAQPEAFVRIDPVRNLLLLAGTRSQIDGWMEIARTFDVDLLKGMSVGVFPLQYAQAVDIETALRAMTASPGTPAAGRGATTGAAAGDGLRETVLGGLRVIPLERLNSLLVVAPRASYLEEVREWIQRLDRPGESGSEPQMFVYPVQNGSAQHLATVLNGIFGDGSNASPAADSGVAPSLHPLTANARPGPSQGGSGGSTNVLRSGSTSGGAAAGPQSTPQQPGTRSSSPGAVTAIAFGPNVRIVGDDLNNSIVIYAPPAEFRKIEAVLKRLDTPATQVMIEATIVEVTLSDELQYGLQWYFTDQQRGGLTGVGQLNLNASGAIRAIQPGLSYALINTPGQVRAVLNALADRSLIRVISSPSLMVLDNHPALISVGDQQPVSTSLTVTDGGTQVSTIEYKDTGVMLNVTPSVNTGDVVSMNIDQAVTDVGAIDSATGQRAFLQRQVTSRVAVKSGEALVLGGLIRDSSTTGSSGIPVLSKIPIVGALFGSQTQNTQRTELLVVITPRVIRTPRDAREVGQEMRNRMRGFQSLVEEQKGLLPPAFTAEPPAESGKAP